MIGNDTVALIEKAVGPPPILIAELIKGGIDSDRKSLLRIATAIIVGTCNRSHVQTHQILIQRRIDTYAPMRSSRPLGKERALAFQNIQIICLIIIVMVCACILQQVQIAGQVYV